MAEAFSIMLIIAAHCVNEAIRAAELLARRAGAVIRPYMQRLARQHHPTESVGEPTLT